MRYALNTFCLRALQNNHVTHVVVLLYCHLTLTVYNSKMLLLNVRTNFSSDQKVFKRLVLRVGDSCKFRIYLTESIALSYKVPMS